MVKKLVLLGKGILFATLLSAGACFAADDSAVDLNEAIAKHQQKMQTHMEKMENMKSNMHGDKMGAAKNEFMNEHRQMMQEGMKLMHRMHGLDQDVKRKCTDAANTPKLKHRCKIPEAPMDTQTHMMLMMMEHMMDYQFMP